MRLRLIAALAVAVVAGGGYLVESAGNPAAPGGSAVGSARVAAQPGTGADAPGASASPGASGRPRPSGSGTPRPSRSPSTTPKPTTTPKPKPPAPTWPPSSASMVNTLLAQINALRAKNGLPPYTLLAGLNRSAHAHNLVMAGGCGMQHQCPGEKGLGTRISAQGVSWSVCGENIGWSSPHPNTASAMIAAAEGLTTAMYNEKPPDDGHRRNLLSKDFHHIGIDVIRESNGKVWLTQDFSS